jgi:tRNA-Thr(GGU) m(6)t(6)A37 methyltransferase TsaA
MRSQKDIPVQAIAVLHSVFQRKFGTPRQGALAPSSRAEVRLQPAWRGKGVFEGLENFSHVWLLTYFHENGPTRPLGKVHPPRLKGKKIGVLASRSPHRPNPIGLTLARLLQVERDRLIVGGVDLIEGTPVLDIKPYVPQADRPEEYKGGWTDEVESPALTCVWPRAIETQIEKLRLSGLLADPSEFKNLVEEMLRQDPRPLVYREREREDYAFLVDGIDVKFKYRDGEFEISGLVLPRAKRGRKRGSSNT